ncbi:MAG TPA: hypothetical protein VGC41_06670 [Kofleriaceae bacterium]
MKAAYISLLALTACATTGDSDQANEQDSSGTSYSFIEDMTGNYDGWFGINRQLAANFDDVCGDTFCEGDWTNIQPLRVYCSVTSKRGDIKDCAWAFTASTHEVNGDGKVLADAVTFQCHFKPATTATKLIAALGGTDPLHTTLPGMGSIYDAIGDCFESPIGDNPINLAPGEVYVDAANYYQSAAGSNKWYQATQNLHKGFDDVCGDTFCGSDYSDVQALDLGCSITKSTGNVKACTWNFGGSFAQINKLGSLAVTSKTWSCGVQVHGTISQMAEILTASGTDNPIQRALPGGVSAYDSIAGCVVR